MNATAKFGIDPGAIKPGATVRILPAGLFRSHDGRPRELQGWRLDDRLAAPLISAKAHGSTDFLIDYEHQSMNSAQNGKPVPAAGWFKRLEWRTGDGLYMSDITWTERAKAMIAAMEYRHLSPVFEYDKDGNVIRIISVALTNTPALTGLTDLAAARAALSCQYSQHAAMTPDERNRFQRWFGFDPMPGQPFAPGYEPKIVQAVAVPTSADLASMSLSDREKYEKVFGPIFADIGAPLPK